MYTQLSNLKKEDEKYFNQALLCMDLFDSLTIFACKDGLFLASSNASIISESKK